MRLPFLLGVLAASTVVAGVLPQASEAARKATTRETRDIRTAVLKKCRLLGCYSVRNVKVSTADTRYGIAAATGLPYNYDAIVARSSTGSRTWRVILVIGGGAPACHQLHAAMPHRVIADFRLGGLDEDGDFVKRCM